MKNSRMESIRGGRVTTQAEEVVLRVPFCGGELQRLRSLELDDQYYAKGSARDDSQSVWFVSAQRRKAVRDLQDLKAVVTEEQCTLASWVSQHEATFVEILAPVIGLGRAVTIPDLYSFLEDKYGVAVSENLPRVEDRRLRFLCVTMLPQVSVVDVELELDRLELRAKAVPLRRQRVATGASDE